MVRNRGLCKVKQSSNVVVIETELVHRYLKFVARIIFILKNT